MNCPLTFISKLSFRPDECALVEVTAAEEGEEDCWTALSVTLRCLNLRSVCWGRREGERRGRREGEMRGRREEGGGGVK